MSYSRWSCSNWYAFHNTYSGEDKDSQLLSLWHVSENKDFFELWSFIYTFIKFIENRLINKEY